jgi:hypothetical protein
VSLPQSAIWQRLRQSALDAIPAGSAVSYRAPITLASWQAQGTYTISSTSASKFALAASPSDFGGALLSDAAFHLDHALEQQASLRDSLSSDQWASPAWQVVTVYYWSYFSAMAFTRLLGRTVWFLTPQVAQQLSAIAPQGSQRVSRGTYEVACGGSLGAELRNISLEKRSRRVHEQLWSTLFGLLESVIAEVGEGVAAVEEERLFQTITRSAHVLGNDWPSTFRNLVNYRPGFAYTAPRFLRSVEGFNYLTARAQTIDGVVSRLEDDVIRMHSQADLELQPQVAARMLADLAILLSRLAHALHDEVVERSGVDRRWLVSKRRFSKQRGLVSDGGMWPC